MEISANMLMGEGVRADVAATYAPHINAAMKKYNIVQKDDVAAFIAQMLHETMMLTRMEEGMSYSSVERIKTVYRRLRTLPLSELQGLVRNPQALANRAYATTNGNHLPGDGWKFRGRGGPHLTGRANYVRASNSIGVDYVSNPDLLTQPADACIVAAWYWVVDSSAQKCALKGDFLGCTKAVNGPAALEHDKREALRLKMLRAMGV